jgi:glucan phosphoethanolaminetransferase (alkaline phosphatase superfamily)
MNFQITFPKRKDFLWIVLLSFIVLIPNTYLAFYGSDFKGASFTRPLAYLCFSFFLFILPSLFVKARVFFIIQGIIVLLAPVEIAHIYMNKMTVTTAFLFSIEETNWGEFSELLTSLKIPIFGLFIVWAFYFYATFRKIQNTWFFSSWKAKLTITGIFLLSLTAVYSYYLVDGNRIPNPDEKFINYGRATNAFLMKFHKTYPYDFFIKCYEVYQTEKRIREGNTKLQTFRFEAVKKDSLNEREIYVFVIGETGRYSSYSINGYWRETSPLLKQIRNIVSYSDFYSEANLTSSSLPFILTRSEAKNYNKSFLEKSFVDAFQEAGFKTYWIGNQSSENSFIHRVARDANKNYFTATDFNSTNSYDENLWPFLDEVLANNDEKALIVLHTLGSHFRYNFRYPDQFEIFNPTFRGAFNYALIAAKNKEQFINTYDNSILYTDFFLAHTIQKIDSLNAVGSLIYVSDHGENLFDTEENLVLHGGIQYTYYDFHVPFFVWTSDKYNLRYPFKAENIRLNKDKKLNTSRIFYSMLDIADITFPGQILEKSVASEKLQEDTVRYIINTNMEIKTLKN